jgi:hypothetical protein
VARSRRLPRSHRRGVAHMQEAGANGLAVRILPDAPGAATPSLLAAFRSGRPTKRTRLPCSCVVYEVTGVHCDVMFCILCGRLDAVTRLRTQSTVQFYYGVLA